MDVFLFILTFSFGLTVIYYRGVCKRQNLTINSYAKKLAREKNSLDEIKKKYDNIREALFYIIDEKN